MIEFHHAFIYTDEMNRKIQKCYILAKIVSHLEKLPVGLKIFIHSQITFSEKRKHISEAHPEQENVGN